MTYQESLQYLYDKLPMFSRIGAAAYKEDISNTIALCKLIGNPQNKFKSIHIAGTNGKGSVSHMLAAVLQTAGYKTGLYTSPHLRDFRERIKINGTLCNENFVIDFVQQIQPAIETIQPSFFEITVAMAFKYFADNNVDIAVIEVGLGGRLDSTNVITPLVSVITNIGWDHMNLLGDTLEKIAFEKAGIIKEKTPVVIGEVLPETKPVFEKVATDKDAPLIFAQEKRYIADWKYEHHKLDITVVKRLTDEHENFVLDLPGIYQTKNIITVLEALQQLQQCGMHIDHKHIKEALSYTKKISGLHGRWELIHEQPSVILDVGHNVDGMQQIVEQIELISFNELHIIIGMVKDKEVEKVLALLPKYANYYFTKAQTPRALPENELAEKATAIGLQGNTYAEVNTAFQHVLQHAHKDDLVLICGSVFLVGEVNAF